MVSVASGSIFFSLIKTHTIQSFVIIYISKSFGTTCKPYLYYSTIPKGQDLESLGNLWKYKHLRFLDASDNALEDASEVVALKNLLHLNLENNALESIPLEAFERPSSDDDGNDDDGEGEGEEDGEESGLLPNLQVVNVAGNAIKELKTEVPFKSLKHLNANFNQLENIDGLTDLPKLESVELRGNRLSNLDALSGLSGLKFIWAAEQQEDGLTSLEGLDELPSLERLHVRGNPGLNSFLGIGKDLPKLQHINARETGFESFEELKPLAALPELKSISLVGTPMSDSETYRAEVLIALPKIQIIDKEPVTGMEREEAKELWAELQAEAEAERLAEEEAKKEAAAIEAEEDEEAEAEDGEEEENYEEEEDED